MRKAAAITIVATIICTAAMSQERVDTLGNREKSSSGPKGIIYYSSSEEGKKIVAGGIDLLEILETGSCRALQPARNVQKSITIGGSSLSGSTTMRVRPRTRFSGNWSGLELGYNGYLMPDGSLDITGEAEFMRLNEGKSVNFNLNFCQIDIGITRHLGFVTGMGLHFSNYRFAGNNNITVSDEGNIVPSYPSDDINYEKTKLVTKYLTAPLFLELQIPTSSRRRVNVAAGVVGGLKVGDHTKVVYRQNGRQKLKDRGDFNLNRFRYGYTIRAGYGSLQLYGTRYETPLFRENRGPELYPYEAGISWTIF